MKVNTINHHPVHVTLIPECLRGVFTTRHYINQCVPLPYWRHWEGHFVSQRWP